MQLVERRMIREQLFGVGHGDVSRNIAARSASGAVVSTAPRGTRALAAPRSPRGGSLARIAAGLLLFGGAKLPKLARSLGQAQKEFKDGLSEGANASSDDAS